MFRSIIIFVAFLSLPCAADTARAAWQDAIGERVKKFQYSAAYEAPSHQPATQTDKDGGEKNLHNIGPDDVDWDGFYITAKGEKIYCPEAFREKRRQYAIKKQKERDELRIANETIAIKTTCIVIGSLALIYLIRNWFKPETPPSPTHPAPPVVPSPQNPQKPITAPPPPNPPDPKTEQGLNYERYIGYRLETEGHIVFYRGAYANEKDKGVDLIAIKNNHIRLIQCKCFNEDIRNHQIQKYLGHIAFDWKSDSNSPIHGLSHDWELHYTPWLSKAAYQACIDNHIHLNKQNVGIAPPVKAFYFEGKKRYMLPNQQFYDLIISYIDGQNHKRFYKPKDAEKEGFSHLELININTANLINREIIENYTHTQTPSETLKRSWLDF